MAYRPRGYSQAKPEEEFVSAKQREALARQKQECTEAMNEKLQAIPVELQGDLVTSRDHALTKFPRFPNDMAVWLIAYYEDWMRKANEAKLEAANLQSGRAV